MQQGGEGALKAGLTLDSDLWAQLPTVGMLTVFTIYLLTQL